MIKIYLYGSSDLTKKRIDCEKQLFASFSNMDQLEYFKNYIIEKYENTKNIAIAYKLPYKNEITIVDTFKLQ